MIQDIQAIHRVIDVFQRAEKLDVVKRLAEDLLGILPKTVLGFDVLSYAYYKAKEYKLAIKYGEFALGASSPEEALAIRYNLGKCYLNGNEPLKACNYFSIVARLQPEKIDVKLDLAAAMYACNKKEEAKELLLELDKHSSQLDEKDALAVQFNLGSHYIREGDFKTGMSCLSIGRQLRIWGSYTHKFPIPEWDGTTRTGKHILIVGEGGIGDELINARFVEHINAKGMRASFASCQGLSSVFSRMPFERTQNYTKFTTDIKDIADYDFWAPAMNLPKILGVDTPDLWYGEYIIPDPVYDAKWAVRIQGPDTRVGVRWSGNPLYEQDLHRSIDLGQVIAAIPESCTVFAIQKENTEVLQEYPEITDLEEELATFEDAIACIHNLDVLVTSCTSVAHAAAALGTRVFVMVPIMDYYVWGEGKTTSSWYGPNVTLIRQTEPGNWNSAYKELEKHLFKYIRSAPCLE